MSTTADGSGKVPTNPGGDELFGSLAAASNPSLAGNNVGGSFQRYYQRLCVQ